MGLHAAIAVCLPWFCGFAPGPQEPAAATDVLRAVMVAPVQPNLAEGLVVEVVDETGKPANGAIVGYFAEDLNQPDEARRRAMEALFPPGQSIDEDRYFATLLLSFGTRYRADAKGRAILPNDARRPVTACWDGMAAMESGVATAAPVRIVLRRPVSVRVRVVDPVGVPVSGVGLGMFRDERDNNGATWLTDRRGEAVMVLLRHLREARQVRIATRLGIEEEPCIRVACDAIPVESLVLQVPETGFVRVIVYGDDERPRKDVVSVSLRPDGKKLLGSFVAGKAEPSGALVRVPLGMTYAVSASLRGASGALQGKCKGPTKPNELIVCDLRATQGPPVLSFIVRGLDGEPVRDEDLGYVMFNAHQARGSEVHSDRDGRVRIVLAAQRPEALELLVMRRGRSSSSQALSQYQGAGRRALPPDLHAGENVLPDVLLAEEPVYVAGLVVDDDGKPVANVAVTCEPGWRRPSGGYSGQSGRQFFQHRVLTDAEGRFELRDAAQQTTVRVSAWAGRSGLAQANEECPARSLTAKLVLRRTGSVRLVLEGLPKTQHELLEGSVVPAGGGPETRRFSVRDAQTTMDLAAGRYDIVLRLDDKAADVLRITGVEVPAGGECNDPRLQIPWREHLTLVTLTVVDRDQRPIKSRDVMQWVEHANRDGGYGGGGGATDEKGQLTLLVPKAGGHLVIAGGGGLRGLGLEAVTNDRTVTLAPEILARIELRGDRSLPEGIQATFQLQARRDEKPAARDLLQSLLHGEAAATLQAGEQGAFQAMVGHAGVFAVQMFVREPLGPGSFRLRTILWGSIDVKDQIEPQSFVLEMPAAEREKFEALIERLKQ